MHRTRLGRRRKPSSRRFTTSGSSNTRGSGHRCRRLRWACQPGNPRVPAALLMPRTSAYLCRVGRLAMVGLRLAMGIPRRLPRRYGRGGATARRGGATQARWYKRGAEDEDARTESDGSELGREPFTKDEMLSELNEMRDAFGADVAGYDGAAALSPPRPPPPRQHKLSDLSVRELNEC